MTKKENRAQKRVPLNISISREVYEWITKIHGNASRIAEQAYLALKNDMEFGYGTDAVIIKLQNSQKNIEILPKSSKFEQKMLKNYALSRN